MRINWADPNDPTTLDEAARAAVLAPLFALQTHAVILVAAGEPALMPDRHLGERVREIWSSLSAGTRQRYIEDALGALRAARFDQAAEQMPGGRQIVHLHHGEKIIGGIFPKES